MAVVEFCTTPGATLDAATRTVTGGGEALGAAAPLIMPAAPAEVS